MISRLHRLSFIVACFVAGALGPQALALPGRQIQAIDKIKASAIKQKFSKNLALFNYHLEHAKNPRYLFITVAELPMLAQ